MYSYGGWSTENCWEKVILDPKHTIEKICIYLKLDHYQINNQDEIYHCHHDHVEQEQWYQHLRLKTSLL